MLCRSIFNACHYIVISQSVIASLHQYIKDTWLIGLSSWEIQHHVTLILLQLLSTDRSILYRLQYDNFSCLEKLKKVVNCVICFFSCHRLVCLLSLHSFLPNILSCFTSFFLLKRHKHQAKDGS